MMNKILLAIAALVLASGCAMKQKILDAGAVSMTHQNVKEGEHLKEKGPVTGQFCADSMNDKGQIGLMDEAIKAAQKENDVDFITNAVFYTTGAGCISVEGTGMKVVTKMAAAPTAPEAPMKKKKTK